MSPGLNRRELIETQRKFDSAFLGIDPSRPATMPFLGNFRHKSLIRSARAPVGSVTKQPVLSGL
jgi:hypothetical protein